MDNLENFKVKRRTYPVFVYKGYNIIEDDDSIYIDYTFVIDNLSEFHPTWTFKKSNEFSIAKVGRAFFDNLVFNLGLVELVSYWKLTCSPLVKIECGALNEEQIKWWKKLYLNGLGEFLYKNGIYEYLHQEEIELINIECVGALNYNIRDISLELVGNLIPVGGGKDSVVTLELLKGERQSNTCYIVNPRGASLSTANIAGYSEVYAPKRTLDRNMLELNSKGFLNGHTPFSAILAFSSYVAAIILGKQYIILSNEASANEPNVEGTNINHQYSKSLEFEDDFRDYANRYLCKKGPEYFSLLRPLSEWQIVKEFVKHREYFKDFKSCNVGSKQDIWCENCPKCLYVYIMLSAFLTQKEMAQIFSTDMLNNCELRDVFMGLISPNKDKPFECVGTKEEVNLSLNMFLRKHSGVIPTLLKDYKLLKDDEFEGLLDKYNNNFDTRSNVPEKFIHILKEV